MSIQKEPCDLIEKVDVLGVDVAIFSKKDLLNYAINCAKAKEPIFITYVNADCMNLIYADEVYFKIIKKADVIYSDGIGVVLAARILRGVALKKITGRDWIVDFLKMCAAEGLKVYILAGEPGVSERAKKKLVAEIPGLEIAGTSHGYLDENESSRIVDEINKSAVDVLMIGMGAPRQEKWVHRYRESLSVPLIWTVGAGFDYFAGVEKPVPEILNRLGLEWLWRLIIDPKGKWKRYLVGIPIFVARIMRQLIGEKLKQT